MKRIALGVLVMAFAGIAHSQDASDWVFAVKGPDASMSYYNVRRFTEVSPQVIETWIETRFSGSLVGPDIATRRVTREQFKCNSLEERVLSAAYYNGDGKAIQTRDFESDGLVKWALVIPDSVGEEILSVVCLHQKQFNEAYDRIINAPTSKPTRKRKTRSTRKPHHSSITLGQTMNAEIDLLREQLGVPASVPIAIANSPDLPKADPLRVYIAAGFDMDVRKRTTERINEWNKKDAQKYGALTVVTELSQADVILVQYSDKEHPINEVGGTSKSVGTVTYIPGNSYIIVPKGQGYEVLWRYQGKSREHGLNKGVAGQTMRDHFFDMLKHRTRK